MDVFSGSGGGVVGQFAGIGVGAGSGAGEITRAINGTPLADATIGAGGAIGGGSAADPDD